jgi:hypothetical protein
MRFCSPGELEALWSAGGLADVRTTALRVEAGYADLDDLWAPLAQGVAPSGAYAASLDQPAQERLRAEIDRRLGVRGGPFRLSARAWCAVGRVR